MEQIQVLPEINFSLETSKKTDRELYVSDVLDDLLKGKVDPLKVHIKLKSMEDIIARFTDKKKYPGTAKRYSELVLVEALKHGQKSFEMFNAKVEIKETGVTYDYSKCEDSEINTMLVEFDELKEKIEKRQKFLQTVSPKGLIIVDPESGETNTVYPPAKMSTTSIAISLK